MQIEELGDLLTTAEAAQLLRVSEGTMHRWREQERGPQYLRMEDTIRYPMSYLTTFMAESLRGASDV